MTRAVSAPRAGGAGPRAAGAVGGRPSVAPLRAMRRSDLSRLAQDVGQDLKRGGRGGHPGKKPTRDGAGPRSPARPDRGGTAPGRTRRPGPPRGGADPAHEAVDLAAADLLSFERKGWLRTRSLVSPGDLAAARAEVSAVVARHEAEALRQRVRVLCPGVPADAVARMSREDARRALRGRDATDEVGFLQASPPPADPGAPPPPGPGPGGSGGRGPGPSRPGPLTPPPPAAAARSSSTRTGTRATPRWRRS